MPSSFWRPTVQCASPHPPPGGVDGRSRPKMLVIWIAGPWVTAALRTGDHPAALSRGGSYWAHRFFGSEIENKSHWAGQVQVVPPFWSLYSPSVEEGSVTSTFEGRRDPPKCRFARESRGRVRSRYPKLFRRWRRPTLARAAVRPVLGRFATWSRRRSGCKPGSAQSGAFETRARFAGVQCYIFASFVRGRPQLRYPVVSPSGALFGWAHLQMAFIRRGRHLHRRPT